MLKALIAGLAGFALLALTAPAEAAEALKVTPPTLQITPHKLANGLQVLLHEDHSAPVVNVQLWYHVGSKDEKKGRSGFAHLFEHIMFKGSENIPLEEFKNLVSSVGGRYNATTDFDRTLYWETIPANYLERILWMEADRMRALDVSEENFKSERDVVKEERRLRVENPPFGRLFEVVLNKTYTTHPYHILPIGSMADLDAATLQDVRDFHSTYYVPNNATLVIAGDLDPVQTMKWIESYFGPIPQGKPIPRDIPKEPAQTAERRTTDYHPNTPLPAVVLTYHVPQAGHPDTYALEVASNILSGGESSRLYKRMVYDKQMALQAGGQTVLLEDPGVFFFFSILQAGQKPEDAEKELQAEVDRLRSEPVSADELAKAKNQLISGLIFGRQTAQDKASAIGYAAVILNDVSLVNLQLALYQKVTAEDVQHAARAYFSPENRTVVYMLPEAMRPGAKDSAKDAAPSEVKKP
ncbi:MAG TPA: pitrilysin family protein [Thermoanaerobaculia bacterium]|jgi:zinc protease|nr:pitrilysin family protein [Thermoanaerobaculia bacterium]